MSFLIYSGVARSSDQQERSPNNRRVAVGECSDITPQSFLYHGGTHMNTKELFKEIKLKQKRKKDLYQQVNDIESRIYYLAQIEAYNEILYILEDEVIKSAEKADKENQ